MHRFLPVGVAALAALWWFGQERPANTELIKTKHLVLPVRIDGKGPFRLIFDTGAPVVMLNQRVAKECGLFDAKRKSPAVAAGSVWPGQVILRSVEAAGATAEAVPAVVLDHPTVKVIDELAGPLDGILGYPFFARFVTTVDYSGPRMTFTPNGHRPEDAMTSVMRGLMSRGRTGAARTIAPAGQWGLEVEKPAGDDQPGVIVRRVFASTPVEKAGLRAGDRLLTIDGRWTDSVDDCFRAASEVPAGQPATVVVRRNEKDSSLTVMPREGF